MGGYGPHSVTYHLNLVAGHKVHLSRQAFVITLLFRENKQQSAQKTATQNTLPHPIRGLHLDMMGRGGELWLCGGGGGGRDV